MIVGDITESTDLLVIGGGLGGYTTAVRAAQRGLDVTLVEKAHLGGTCLGRGCIPLKALTEAARDLDRAKHLAERGGPELSGDFDMTAWQAWKGQVVARLEGGVRELLALRGVHVVSGTGRFLPDGRAQVALEDGTQMNYLFRRAVIATGSSPRVLEAIPPDGARILTVEDALDITALPHSLVVVGRDMWAAELVSALCSLGSRVRWLVTEERALPGFDHDLVAVLTRHLEARGAEIHFGTEILGTEVRRNRVDVAFRIGDTEAKASGTYAVVSAGRLPNLSDIALDALPGTPALDDDGFLVVNERQETRFKKILAVGDATGAPPLADRAIAQGLVAGDVAAGRPAAYDHRALPMTVFTDPEIATVGLGEDQAQADGFPAGVACFPVRALGRAALEGLDEGFVKIVFDPENHIVLGGEIVGPRATDLIGEVALAVETAALLEDLSGTIHAHPTYAEAIREATWQGEGVPLHIFGG